MADDDVSGEFDPKNVEYGLIMPFVVVQSKDGPFEDNAYVCGYEAGVLAGELAFGNPQLIGSLTIHSENLPQIDLLAMRFGYVVSNIQKHGGEWTSITLTRGENG